MARTIGGIDVLFTDTNRHLENTWVEYGHKKQVLPKGWTKDEGRRPLPCDMIWEKDIEIRMRDGTKLLGDVFRPVDTEHGKRVPALMPWSPYGKTGTGKQSLDWMPNRVGIPRAGTSGLEKWEAPDPAEWVPRGYAVVHVDARGSFMSEGDYFVYGTQEGRDGYDSIEWIAAQSWCNESVAMVGNSWLGTTQWFIAAEQPPHLAAMAPWEGLGDYYRQSICRGGIPDHAFWDALFGFSGGQSQREDVSAMVEKYSLWNAYWEDKKPKLANITTPLYATASYSTGLHTEGSFRGFFLSSSKEKWLRVHTTQEWHDLYQPENVDDLAKFLDKYTKKIDNGWEKTSPIRLSLLGYNQPSVVHRPVTSYPPPEFQYKTLHLDAKSASLGDNPAKVAALTDYDSTGTEGHGDRSTFKYTFDKYTELCGFSKVQLFMSTKDHDDMDVYVVLKKLDSNGAPLTHQNIPMKDLPAGTTLEQIPHNNIFKYVGPNGRLRASHRAVGQEPGYDAEKLALLSDAYVWHPHDREEKIVSGEIVKLDIMLWPGGMVFHEGESMSLQVMGHLPVIAEFEGLENNMVNYNKGQHVIHTGPDHPSTLYVALSSGAKEQ